MVLSDHYVLWSWAFILMLVATGLYVYREHWTPVLKYIPVANHSFEDDIEAGLSSDSFSLAGNVTEGDTRAGLDVAAKKEILRIMKTRSINFDEARAVYMETKFAKNGIGADGRPTDPKAVFFS